MTEMNRLPRRLSALMIDGDNISPARAEEIYALLQKTGLPEVRRVYGNVALTKGWATRPGFRTIHSGEGKNATDLLLSIEAMDLLHQGRLGRMVLVSSDGDFTHLVHRLREEGVVVISMGEAKTPQTMREACSSFIPLEPQRAADPENAVAPAPKSPPETAAATKTTAQAPALLPATPPAQTAPQSPAQLPARSPAPSPVQKAPKNLAKPAPASIAPSKQKSPAAAQASKPRDAEVLARVQAVIAQCTNPRGAALNRLGVSLHKQLHLTPKALGAPSWHDWFSRHPEFFICEPKGPDCHIRLAKPPQRRDETA